MAGNDDEVRWLTPQEREAWLALAALITKLPGALDSQLQRDADLSFMEYMVLAMLSEREDRTMQMSEIAAAVSASLSRLSHTAKRLEKQGFLHRERIPGAGRATNAILTDSGYQKVVASAPGHVMRVRELVMDAASPEQLAAVRELGHEVLNRLDESFPRD